MTQKYEIEKVKSELKLVADLELNQKSSDLKRLSKDFYDYSPILNKQLKNFIAEIVVRPLSVNAIINTAEICNKYSVPLTLRGSGTGNYGQCVPLHGGVVMLMNALSRIRNFDTAPSRQLI